VDYSDTLLLLEKELNEYTSGHGLAGMVVMG